MPPESCHVPTSPNHIMNIRTLPVPAFATVILCGVALFSGGCRKSQSTAVTSPGPVAVMAPELETNGLGGLPGAVYQSQAASPIHWQPWSKATLMRARDARRLLFCVIAMPQQPGFQSVLDDLARDPSALKAIHDHYVPVLIDGDASREVGLLTADLSAEIKRPLQMPLFVWLTHEGNPVAWIPGAASGSATVLEMFNQWHTTVSEMWQEDLRLITEERKPSYVLKNSNMNNANRRDRLAKRKISRVVSEQPAADVVRAIRQLASLYDPVSRSFDEAGGLVPSGALELLAAAANNPGLPADARARSLETTRELLADLLPSAMFDPLDGGGFSARRSGSWSLPSFVRDCPGQARVALALIEAFRATSDPRALEKALGMIAFAEKNYGTSEGLFSVGLSRETDPAKWMWSVEDVEKELGSEDSAWWIKATGMKGLGNLPSEADPRREYFRANTLALAKSMAEIAAELGQPVEAFTPRFEAAKAKLLAARNARIGGSPKDECSHAGATFRMVALYAAAFGATGDESYREKAVSLLKRSRDAFGVGPKLRAFSKDAPPPIGAGRAFLYALAIQSAIDVAAITSDEQWLVWSEDLATTAAEMFTGNGFLKECPDDAKLIDLPVTDLVMLFDDSTAGLVSSAESRLAEIGRPLVASFSELATPMPTYAIDRPILHTDLLLATLARHYKVTIAFGTDLPPAMKTAVERLSIRSVQRRQARSAEQVPAGSVKVLLANGESHMVSTPEALREVLLPSPGN